MEDRQDVQSCLHQARLKSNLDLKALSARTALSPGVVRKIDEGRFGELPAGVYARSYVKSFAVEVGLDPEQALKTVEHLLPDAPDPLPGMRELNGPSPAELILNSVIGKLRPRAVQAETPVVPAATRALQPETMKESAPELRMWLPSEPVANVQGKGSEPADVEVAPPVRRRLTRWGAAALDAAVLIAINAGLVLLIAWGSGLAARSLVRERSIALGALCSVPTVLYFILFNGIAGQTLGGWLCRLPRPGQHEPLTLDAILRRSILK